MIVKAQEVSAPSHLLTGLDPELFSGEFNRRPFMIGHRLADHPLLQLDRLVELCQRLPESNVEYNAGNLPMSQDPSKTPRNGLSPDETIQRIAENRSWLVLKNVEQDPAYSYLLDACLDEMRPYVDPVAPGMRQREAFIFVSSPGSVTPYHIDPENNFLLQVRGTKKVHMFDPTDRVVLSEERIESFFMGSHRNLEMDENLMERGQWFDLLPGSGLHFPVVAPHWVQNGPEVSVSFSITFQTDDSARRQSLHRLNAWLRKRGMRPADVGASGWRDQLKMGVVQAGRMARRVWGK